MSSIDVLHEEQNRKSFLGYQSFSNNLEVTKREDKMDDFVEDEEIFWSLKLEVLHDMRDELAKNLYPDKFFSYFRSKRIFDADDCENINAEKTRRKQAELFLDILESKGPEAFDEFCRFINKNKTQIYLLQKILDKFEQKKGEILGKSCLYFGYNST